MISAPLPRPSNGNRITRGTVEFLTGIRRGMFTSVKELNTKIRTYIDGWNTRRHPFVWTETADEILKKAKLKDISNARH